MRWQTVVRALLAASLMAVAGLVVWQWRGRTTIDDGAAGPASAPLTDPQVSAQREQGVWRHTDGAGNEIYAIEYQRMRAFGDDRTEFEGATTTFLRNGAKHTLVSPMARLLGRAGPTGNEPERIEFPKGVQLSAEGGVAVDAPGEATLYNVDQKLVIPGKMSFRRGRLSGGGVGADLYMDRSVLWILDQAQLTVAPEIEGGTPIEASAKKIGLAEMEHYMVLEENAVIAHQSQRLGAHNARVAFAPVGDVVQFIELRGNSSVRSTDTSSTRPTLTANNINLEFAPETGLLTHTRLVESAKVELRESGGTTTVRGSEIDMFMAPDGETLSKLQATAPVDVSLPRQGDQPAKSIKAQMLLAEGDGDKGLSRAVFNGGVEYAETRPAGRGQSASVLTTTAETLTLGLKGDLAEVDSAIFRQNVIITDGPFTATAGEAQYDSRAESLRLRGQGRGGKPKVVDAQIDVQANEIDADLKNDAFDARALGQERVESSFSPQNDRKVSTGLFEGGKRISGTSARLRFSRTSGQAVYDGAVYLRQGEGSLAADHVELDDKKGDLKANGTVSSRIVLDDPNAQTPGKPTRIDAAAMIYTDATRLAVYSGGAQLDTASGERLTGDRITLTLEAGERKLKSMEAVAGSEANNEVRVTLPEGRQAAGRRLTYDAATGVYRVFGAPATIIAPAPDRGPDECTLTTGTDLRLNRTKAESFVDNKGGALGASREVKCGEVKKR